MILAIDPGVVTLGAAWYGSTMCAGAGTSLVLPYMVRAYNVSSYRKTHSPEDTVNFMLAALERDHAFVTRSCRVNEMVIEKPILFRGGLGHAVASSGGLVDLAAAFGQIIAFGYSQGMVVSPVPVHEWKGQLPKKVVQNRIRALYSRIGKSKRLSQVMGAVSGDHHWDALGIALHSRRLL